MSYTNLIKNTLDILDLNITFTENSLEKERIKGRICQVFSGTLDYLAHSCLHCGEKEKGKIIRWGYTTCLILMNDVSEYQTYLRLKKRRFFCYSCERTFVAETSLIQKGCSISKKVKLSIADRLRKVTSMSEIARQKKVSVSSVYRVLKQFYEPKKINRLTLPEVLCFDEFKSVKQVAASMSFIMMDGQTKQLIDVIENRQLSFLQRYFSRFSLSVRERVKYIVCDMYAPYFSLVKKLFPMAQIILDRFHIVQHIGRTFLKHRIQRMNLFLQKGTVEAKKYRHLKKCWKLLQKNQSKLDFEKRQWRPSFRTYLTETELVDRLLAYDEELKSGYTCYQNVLYAVQTRDYTRFHSLLEQDCSGLPVYYQTVFSTFKKVQNEIKHALELSYSNGPLECLNNHIKVLKRNAYGFRNFYNFKLRIALCFGNVLFQPNRKT
ncbi:ISL3 family transposase [Enterococcus sp. AZ126]|uniref:ISL3 family transposase n=1 Tax=Enterococcus sp. AZ126 TaxID=2774635 RepID=UPI003F1EA347